MFSNVFVVCFCIGVVLSPRGNRSTEEYVDLIELNHFYDQYGRLVYDQVIFYEQAPESGRFQVRAWCLVEDRETLNRRPVKNLETQLYQVDWFDSDQRMVRKITSRLYRESWTQHDPERVNKKVHEERLRIAMMQHPSRMLTQDPPPLDEPKQTATNEPNAIASIPTPIAEPAAPESTPQTNRADALVVR